MKRGLFLVFLAILLIPFVSATIYTESTLGTQYNFGDSIQLSGNLVESQDVSGLLSIYLACGNESQQLAAKSITVKSQESVSFSYKLPITGNLVGSCRFSLLLKDFSNNLIEQYDTSSFNIIKELIGNFDISSKEFQFGDKLVINGNVQNLNLQKVNGLAIIYIKKDGINYLVDSKEIVNSLFTYETKLTSLPAGSYSIDIEVSDSNGNRKLFENNLNFVLYNELIIASKFSQAAYLPGDVLSLTGNVHKKTGPSVSDTKIEINFENKVYTSDVKDGQFSFNSVLSKTIKSYFHNITFSVKDSDSNYGYQENNFEITPIPTKLEGIFDKDGYIPEDTINLKVNLLDQAGDILARELKVKITDVNGNVIVDETKLTTDVITYKLPQFSKPGNWKLNLESEGLKFDSNLVVEEIEILNVELVGQTLEVKNMGNKLYDNNIDIDSDGIVKSQKIRLDPTESTTIELYKLFKDGTHTINVLGKTFTVSIADPRNLIEKGMDGLGSITGYYTVQQYGKVPSTGYLILLILISITVLTLVLQFVLRMNVKKKPDHIQRKYSEPYRDFVGVQEPKVVKEEPKKYNFQFGKADERDLADFKRRMNDTYERDRRKFNVNKRNDDNNGGPFSMFN
ncbi:MAG: hypothetical protein PHF86_03855 [Candidatus Nanoarchaeia archaeon]|nr:hypothetical protein [Candidatus Nanoarchaeia archaeon]